MTVRPTEERDRRHVAQLYADVADERLWIGAEPPVDVEVVGSIHVHASGHGFGEIGMMVAKDRRGRGVGTALMEAAIDWARERGMHKLSLTVFAHNEPALALYRKLGFVEEGRRLRHYRRRSGELWDGIDMGLFL